MLDLFVIGGFWFWTWLTIVTIILFACIEDDRGVTATAMVAVTVLLLCVFGDLSLSVIWHNPWQTFAGILGYFIVGTGWCIAKWLFYVKDQREKYDELKDKFIINNKLEIAIKDPIPDEHKDNWLRMCHSLEDINPEISRHKDRVYVWIAYWPWSFVWTMINDPVRKILKKIYKNISSSLQAISDYYFKDIKQDFK